MAGSSLDLAKDFRALLRAFVDRDVRFLIVGAYALAVLGRRRATGDPDVWIEATTENAARAHRALGESGALLRDLTAVDRPHRVWSSKSGRLKDLADVERLAVHRKPRRR